MPYKVKNNRLHPDGKRVFPKVVTFHIEGKGEVIPNLNITQEWEVVGHWMDQITQHSLFTLELDEIPKNNTIHDDFEIKEKVFINYTLLLSWIKGRNPNDEQFYAMLRNSLYEGRNYETVFKLNKLKYHSFSKNTQLNDLLNLKLYNLEREFDKIYSNISKDNFIDIKNHSQGIIPFIIHKYENIFDDNNQQIDLFQQVDIAYNKIISYQTAQKYTKQVINTLKEKLKATKEVMISNFKLEKEIQSQLDFSNEDSEKVSFNLSNQETAALFDLFKIVEIIPESNTKARISRWLNRNIISKSGPNPSASNLENHMAFFKYWTPNLYDFIFAMHRKSLEVKASKEKSKK